MANEGWKQVKVYVASGYFDMEGERQALFNDVLPQLSLMCVPLRVAVSFVDLRVGVHENQFWELLSRSGCTPLLAEIDRCSPFFVGLYGAKYGKQLQEYKFPVEPRWAKISKTYPKGRSVLELETHWAALRDPSRYENYARNPESRTPSPLAHAQNPQSPVSLNSRLSNNQPGACPCFASGTTPSCGARRFWRTRICTARRKFRRL